MNKDTLKSIGAILAGFFAAVVLAVATDAALEGIGFYPPATKPEAYTSWMFFVSLVDRNVYTLIGGFVIGKLAPREPMKHVAVLAIVATLLGIGGIFASWNTLPHWYVLAQAVLAFPTVWFGGKLAA